MSTVGAQFKSTKLRAEAGDGAHADLLGLYLQRDAESDHRGLDLLQRQPRGEQLDDERSGGLARRAVQRPVGPHLDTRIYLDLDICRCKTIGLCLCSPNRLMFEMELRLARAASVMLRLVVARSRPRASSATALPTSVLTSPLATATVTHSSRCSGVMATVSTIIQ